jgi:hypothetical protein
MSRVGQGKPGEEFSSENGPILIRNVGTVGDNGGVGDPIVPPSIVHISVAHQYVAVDNGCLVLILVTPQKGMTTKYALLLRARDDLRACKESSVCSFAHNIETVGETHRSYLYQISRAISQAEAPLRGTFWILQVDSQIEFVGTREKFGGIIEA